MPVFFDAALFTIFAISRAYANHVITSVLLKPYFCTTVIRAIMKKYFAKALSLLLIFLIFFARFLFKQSRFQADFLQLFDQLTLAV